MKNRIIIFVMTVFLMQTGSVLLAQEGDVSQLMLNKYFSGESMETTKPFLVNSHYSRLELQLYGSVEKGKIVVTFIKPNGVVFRTIEIDPSSDVTFKQTFDLDNGPSNLTGEWQLRINTVNAEGSYTLSIKTR